MAEDQEKVRARSRRSAAKRRAEAIAAGLCVKCKQNPPREGLRTCQECAEKQRQHMVDRWQRTKSQRRIWRDMERCTLCGGVRAPGKVYCTACTKREKRHLYPTDDLELTEPRRTKNNDDLDHVAQEANERGLTYGQLVAMRYMEGMR